MTNDDFILAVIGCRYAHELLTTGKLPGQRLGPQDTPFGKSQPVYRCRSTTGEFLLLLRHGDTAPPIASSFANHRANIYALKALGTTHVLSWSAARAVSHNYRVGQFVVVHDLIDETRHRVGTFFKHGALVDLRQWPVFCPTLRTVVIDTLDRCDMRSAQHGVYFCSEGPRRETPAEVQKYAMWGADLLGHSLAPEAFLARELQMCYAAVCLVAEFAETGSEHRPFEAGSLFDGLAVGDDQHRAESARRQIPRIVEGVMSALVTTDATCNCRTRLSELFHDKSFEGDFRSWFNSLCPVGRHGYDRPTRSDPIAPTPPTVRPGSCSYPSGGMASSSKPRIR